MTHAQQSGAAATRRNKKRSPPLKNSRLKKTTEEARRAVRTKRLLPRERFAAQACRALQRFPIQPPAQKRTKPNMLPPPDSPVCGSPTSRPPNCQPPYQSTAEQTNRAQRGKLLGLNRHLQAGRELMHTYMCIYQEHEQATKQTARHRKLNLARRDTPTCTCEGSAYLAAAGGLAPRRLLPSSKPVANTVICSSPSAGQKQNKFTEGVQIVPGVSGELDRDGPKVVHTRCPGCDT